MIKNIIFDLGGVIMTIDQPQAVSRFKSIGLADADTLLDPYTQFGIFGDLEEGKISAETFRRKLSDMVGRQLTYDQCQYAWKGYCREVPSRNLDFLRMLRSKGYRLILLSNTNPYMMDWAMSGAFDGKGNSIASYFDSMYMSYKVKMMKPSADFFKLVIDSEGVDVNETIFVDDGPRNVEAAARLGLHTFCPTNGEDWTGQLKAILGFG